ncbi:MAG: tRNA1(Val) (adenine(37)-N6)-methyltransferase [Hyphomicrobiaceae bacterium]|jgi:tRNA1(Val) A37 N6-methylase TrmN6
MTGADAPTDDAFLGGRLRLLQPARGYRAGVDAVLLAACAPVAGAVDVIDAGSGVGTVGLCVAARCPEARVTLVEREPGMVELARQNVARNGLADRVRVIEADLGDASALDADSFDHLLANPPYQIVGRGRRSPDAIKAAAHEMPPDGLETWARFFARVVRPGGRVTVIHRADALSELLAVLDGRFGAVLVKPVHPRSDEPAIRVLVQATKGSRAPLTIAPPMALHAADGSYTPHLEAVLREGAAVDLGA